MALNIVNEKIYTVLWFWYIMLAVVTGLGLVWRMLTMILHSRFLNLVSAYFSAVRERETLFSLTLVLRLCKFTPRPFAFLLSFSPSAKYLLDGLDTLVQYIAHCFRRRKHGSFYGAILSRSTWFTLSYKVVDLTRRGLLLCFHVLGQQISSAHFTSLSTAKILRLKYTIST